MGAQAIMASNVSTLPGLLGCPPAHDAAAEYSRRRAIAPIDSARAGTLELHGGNVQAVWCIPGGKRPLLRELRHSFRYVPFVC